jgi:hypothetical protein
VKTQILATAILLIIAARSEASQPQTILESATTSLDGLRIPLTVDQFQYLGCRFHLDQPTNIEAIGGRIWRDTADTTVFGAIATLTSPNGFPELTPKTFSPIAVTTFTTPISNQDTNDLLVPLSVLLQPGDYAIIFGSNRFGATGKSAMDRPYSETSQASFFLGQISSTLSNGNWVNYSGFNNVRFLVIGTPVPEPSTLALFAIGCVAIGCRRRRA